MVRALKTYHAYTACGAYFEGCVAPSPEIAKRMILRRCKDSFCIADGKRLSLAGFVVKATEIDPLYFLLYENALEILVADSSNESGERLRFALEDMHEPWRISETT
jgi:hypothetical protein